MHFEFGSKKATCSATEVQQAAEWWEGKGLLKKQESWECQGKHAWASGQYPKEKEIERRKQTSYAF